MQGEGTGGIKQGCSIVLLSATSCRCSSKDLAWNRRHPCLIPQQPPYTCRLSHRWLYYLNSLSRPMVLPSYADLVTFRTAYIGVWSKWGLYSVFEHWLRPEYFFFFGNSNMQVSRRASKVVLKVDPTNIYFEKHDKFVFLKITWPLP